MENESPKPSSDGASLIAAVIFAAYVAGALLTFGHLYNASQNCGKEPAILEAGREAWRDWYECKQGYIPAVPKSMAWPLYWTAIGAIEVTK